MKRSHSVKDEIKSKVKGKANELILAKMPMWKQMNHLLRLMELQDAKGRRPLNPKEESEVANLFAAWASVKMIRERSDQLEGQIDGGANVDLENGWPT